MMKTALPILVLLAACDDVDSATSASDIETLVSTFYDDVYERLEINERGLAELRDREAIRDIAMCYGRGLDILGAGWSDRANTTPEALELLSDCYADDAVWNVFVFDDAFPPLATLPSTETYAQFIASTFDDAGYNSTRHLVSNIAIHFEGPDRAIVHSSSVTPHFLRVTDPASVTPSVDLITGLYVDVVERREGRWVSVEKSVTATDWWRGEGTFPFGQTPAEMP